MSGPVLFEIQAPTDGILASGKDAEILQNRQSLGRGDFYVTERDVVFIGTEKKIRLEYKSISVHALSKDANNFPNKQCIFMLVNEEDLNHVDEPDVSEYHVVANEVELETLYDALCQGQSLNPDEDGDETNTGMSGMGGIDLNGFTWAPGYGPDSLFGNGGNVIPGPGAGGDAAIQFANMNLDSIPIYDPSEDNKENGNNHSSENEN